MPSIRNKTRRPLAVPLPGGKKLRLGPLQTGQVTPKALEHPPLVKLIEAGELELAIESARRSGSGNAGRSLGPGRKPGGGIHHVGDQ